MDVKPIATASSVRINSSSETRDDSSRRERSFEERKRSPKPTALQPEATKSEPPQEPPPPPPEVGQWIDSGKVIELLAHRPSARNIPNPFKKMAIPSRETGAVSDGKKLDRSC